MVPKVQTAAEVHAVADQLQRLERQAGLVPGAIGLDIQIEDALGLVNVDAIAAASPRIVALSFGPADFMASINMRSLAVGLQPPGYIEGDAYHYVLMRILVAGRAFGRQVLDGPYLGIKDADGLRLAARRSAALGFDGKWVVHPDQIGVVNEVFTPSQSEYDRAELILAAYQHHTSVAGGARGAAMLDGEMIDEASRAMAAVVAAKGRAAGLVPTVVFRPPI
jgi:citrate lyase subunit beta/citryl-CoA lyase